MKNKTPYLTQYYNLLSEWEISGICIDHATQDQLSSLHTLQAKAIKQSGLSRNELAFIVRCRKYRIFTKVNVYSLKETQIIKS
ncbi:MAG: hypothetical protein FWH03_02135 [Firmicutes bacterium]|nr:hypothetical protein [Bacillota bacterium]